MIEDTINNDRTVAGGGEDMILAGRYHIFRQSGPGGMGSDRASVRTENDL